MVKGSKHSAEGLANLKVGHSYNGACKRGHMRTPENTNEWGCCQPCKNLMAVRWHKAHPVATSEKTRKDNRIKSAKIGAYAVEYKRTHPCVDCGESDPIVLVFDHRDRSTKKFKVRSSRSWKSLMAEIAKCDVLCCNCHARRHAAHGWIFKKGIS